MEKVSKIRAFMIARDHGVDKMYDMEEFRMGLEVEQEHAKTIEAYKRAEIPVMEAVARTVCDHLAEDPHYYTKLARAGL